MTLAPPGDAAPEADPDDGGPLEGELLIAMPAMGDPRFAQTVIFMCSHGDDGAMGLIINKRARELSFADLLKQVGVNPGEGAEAFSVHFGGPVEMGRGFVLHSDDWEAPGATKPLSQVLTPRQAVLALGYAGWAPGQLERELQANGWLICPSDPELVFGEDDEGKWRRAMLKIGVDPAKLSAQSGLA